MQPVVRSRRIQFRPGNEWIGARRAARLSASALSAGGKAVRGDSGTRSALVGEFDTARARGRRIEMPVPGGCGSSRDRRTVPAIVEVFREIYREAEKQRNTPAHGPGRKQSGAYHRTLGELNESLAYARKALPLLEQLDSRVHLVKLRWCVGDILREQGKLSEAIEAYRAARLAAEEVGMRGDVAAIHLVLADVLLEVGPGTPGRVGDPRGAADDRRREDGA